MIRLCCFVLLMALPLAAAPGTADEMLVAFQAKAAAGEGFDELLATIPALPAAEQKRLLMKIDTTWPRLRDDYLRELSLTARNFGGKKTDNRQEIRKHRATFKDVYAKDEATMKPLLKSESMPAVEQLRKLLSPASSQIIATCGAKMETQRKLVVGLAKFRDGTLKVLGSTQPLDSSSTLEAREKAIAEEICGFDHGDVKILTQNRKLAKDKGVPEAEVRGIEECNELRMLVGLNALILDPKLCAAARDHSKDMAEKGFFAHESPVSGKRLPWDRAKNFGTSASSENIFMGSADSHAANMGWFYSPGHHKNMFMPGLARIGMGCSGNHWTQMFGR